MVKSVSCVAATLVVALVGPNAMAGPVAASSAYGLQANLTFNGDATSVGPVASIAGSAPPAYNKTRYVGKFNVTRNLDPGVIYRPTLAIDSTGIRTQAASSGIGLDFVNASAAASLNNVNLTLVTNPPPPLGIAGVLGLAVSATGVQSSGNFSLVFPRFRTASGDASFGSLLISGGLIGKTLTFSGDAAPNTVLYSSSTVTITLDKQVIPLLISCSRNCTTTPESITTDAIDISLNGASLFGGTVSGDIIIGQSYADPPRPAPVPEPSAIAVIAMGLLGLARGKLRRGQRGVGSPGFSQTATGVTWGRSA